MLLESQAAGAGTTESFMHTLGRAHVQMQSLLADDKLARVGRIGDWALRKLGGALGRPLNLTMLDAFEPKGIEQAAFLMAAAAGRPADDSSSNQMLQTAGSIALFLVWLWLLVWPYRMCPSMLVLIASILVGWTMVGWLLLVAYAWLMCNPA